MIKVGINGFGRIGRFVFRAAMTRNDIQIVGINDLCPVDYLAYMLKYDTMHGQFDGTIEADVENSKLIVNGNEIRVTAERNPADLKWDAVGAEYVVESTGLFLSKDKAQAHIEAGAKYVVMSAPSKDDTPMFVCGVNFDKYVKGQVFKDNFSEELIKKTLKTFIRRFFTQQFKRNCMPEGPKATEISLSPRGDWQMASEASCKLYLKELD